MSPAAAWYPHPSPNPTSNIINREAIAASNPLASIPKLPLLAIKGALCFRCFAAPAGPLVKCHGCKRASYCSSTCREWDWDAQHASQCGLLQTANELEKRQGLKKRSWEEYSVGLFHECHQLRGHADEETTNQVTRLVGYQPYCSGCHRTASQIPLSNLRSCQRCRLVFTCGTCSVDHSTSECSLYRRMADLELLRLRTFEDSGSGRCTASTLTPRSSFASLSSANDWRDYFSSSMSDERNSCTNLTPDLSPSPPSRSWMSTHELRATTLAGARLSLATESMSIPMTILACLEDTLPDLQSRSELTIHLVGASSREVADIVLFEELLHLLPELRHISIVLAGPEAPGEEGDGNAGSELVEMECCAACTTQGRRRTCRLFRGVYDAFGRSEVYQKPDLAVLFHSGRSQKEVESWRPTTRFLVDNAILTLCTTYTEREAVEEVAELDQWGVNVVVRPEVNKWRALVPIPKWWEGREHDVFFVNYWRYVFRGRALVG